MEDEGTTMEDKDTMKTHDKVKNIKSEESSEDELLYLKDSQFQITTINNLLNFFRLHFASESNKWDYLKTTGADPTYKKNRYVIIHNCIKDERNILCFHCFHFIINCDFLFIHTYLLFVFLTFDWFPIFHSLYDILFIVLHVRDHLKLVPFVVTDLARKTHLLSLGYTFNEEESCFKNLGDQLFNALKMVRDTLFPDVPLRFDQFRSDGALQIKNGIMSSLSENGWDVVGMTWIHCYVHVLRGIDRRKFTTTEIKSKFRSFVKLLAHLPDRDMFERAFSLFSAHFNALDADSMEWFTKEYGPTSNRKYWNRSGAGAGYKIETNNNEGTNNALKETLDKVSTALTQFYFKTVTWVEKCSLNHELSTTFHRLPPITREAVLQYQKLLIVEEKCSVLLSCKKEEVVVGVDFCCLDTRILKQIATNGGSEKCNVYINMFKAVFVDKNEETENISFELFENLYKLCVIIRKLSDDNRVVPRDLWQKFECSCELFQKELCCGHVLYMAPVEIIEQFIRKYLPIKYEVKFGSTASVGRPKSLAGPIAFQADTNTVDTGSLKRTDGKGTKGTNGTKRIKGVNGVNGVNGVKGNMNTNDVLMPCPRNQNRCYAISSVLLMAAIEQYYRGKNYSILGVDSPGAVTRAINDTIRNKQDTREYKSEESIIEILNILQFSTGDQECVLDFFNRLFSCVSHQCITQDVADAKITKFKSAAERPGIILPVMYKIHSKISCAICNRSTTVVVNDEAETLCCADVSCPAKRVIEADIRDCNSQASEILVLHFNCVANPAKRQEEDEKQVCKIEDLLALFETPTTIKFNCNDTGEDGDLHDAQKTTTLHFDRSGDCLVYIKRFETTSDRKQIYIDTPVIIGDMLHVKGAVDAEDMLTLELDAYLVYHRPSNSTENRGHYTAVVKRKDINGAPYYLHFNDKRQFRLDSKVESELRQKCVLLWYHGGREARIKITEEDMKRFTEALNKVTQCNSCNFFILFTVKCTVFCWRYFCSFGINLDPLIL
jgi:hypothetical protein